MFKINVLVFMFVVVMYTNALTTSMGMGLTNNMNKIKLSKISNPSLLKVSSPSLTNKLNSPLNKIMRTRGGSISEILILSLLLLKA